MSVCADSRETCGRIRTSTRAQPPKVCAYGKRWRCTLVGSLRREADHRHPISPSPGYKYRARAARHQRDREAAFALLRELRGESE